MEGHELRCSDVDRERVAEALRKAAADGRLTLAELEDRLEATFNARTYGDLQPITKDLPEGAYPIPGQPRSGWKADAVPRPASQPVPRDGAPQVPAERSQRLTAICSSQQRSAVWQVPERMDVTAVLGDVTLDFCETDVPHDEVVVNVGAVLGSVRVIVPPGTDVRTEDVNNILGDIKHKVDGPAEGGPVYRIRGFVLLGDLKVRTPRVKRR